LNDFSASNLRFNRSLSSSSFQMWIWNNYIKNEKWFDFWCFNVTFNNISAISVLVVEEAGENHRPWTSNW
jgi:hypothetical protein